METSQATTTQATERVFIWTRDGGLPNVPVTFSQIEADRLAYASPEVRVTASADVRSDGSWAVSLDVGQFSPEDKDHFFVEIFAGSEEDAKEVARLVREPAILAVIEADIKTNYAKPDLVLCPEARKTAFAYDDGDGYWVTFIDYDKSEHGGEGQTFVGGIFRGSEEDAEEVARLVRESANATK